ncbi:acetate--CoA ligase [Paenibacillus sp. GXUN7292]|uniref:acetate--CoA ligase n=1 Tax=Paenibacillus sp. GXUN7292 TaxID=3422499 RepID=UPI003D7D4DAF
MTLAYGNLIQPLQREHHLQDYQKAVESFNWQDVEQHFTWYKTGKVNMVYECLDRHVDEGYGDKLAIHYINGDIEEKYTFAQLKQKTDHVATVYKNYGIQKGDRVFIFLPKNPDCYIAILAAIKIGAIAGPLFEGFMEESIKDRMLDCGAKLLVTDHVLGKRVPKSTIPTLETVLIAGEPEQCEAGEISLYAELRNTVADANVIEWGTLDDGFIIHYTSGSTGKPKGVLHRQKAMIHQYLTGKWVCDVKEDDVYWCTSHPGWVTGSVYGLYAPWLNRATVVIHGGRFDADSWYSIIEKAGVTIWYSAPTAFRMLMAEGEQLHLNYDLSSLRHVLSVGEPLNPEAIRWAIEELNVRIHDTWWMTETGGHLIVNFPSQPIKPGSMGRAFPGITVAILDEDGQELPNGEIGQLCVKADYPGLMKEIWNNPEKFHSYFPYEGWYVSGDMAYKDDEGYIFFQGRNDDMINSAGESISPFEVESKLIEHPAVAEAGVIGKPDALRGEIVKAFIVLGPLYKPSSALLEEIRLFVRNHLSAHNAPREIEVLEQLPKTRISGKIMRRVLKAWELNLDPGDTSQLDGGVLARVAVVS